jgi:hypothetical protein
VSPSALVTPRQQLLGFSPYRTSKDQSYVGTAVTAAGSANTKGSWVELDASAAFNADGFFVHLLGITTTRDYLVDIGIGGAGAESVLLPNLPYCSGVGFRFPAECYVPLPITAGTRIAARCQSANASAVVHMGLELVQGQAYRAMRKTTVTAIGVNTGDSGGTDVDAGAVAGSFGAWTTISASLASPVTYAIICAGNRANSGRTLAWGGLELAVGAAGFETKISEMMQLEHSDSEVMLPMYRSREYNLAAGQRLAARSICENADATDRIFDLTVMGFS